MSQFNNLIPVINSSVHEETYLSSIFHYLADNIHDLNLLSKLIEYTKRFQYTEKDLIDDKNGESEEFDPAVYKMVEVRSNSKFYFSTLI